MIESLFGWLPGVPIAGLEPEQFPAGTGVSARGSWRLPVRLVRPVTAGDPNAGCSMLATVGVTAEAPHSSAITASPTTYAFAVASATVVQGEVAAPFPSARKATVDADADVGVSWPRARSDADSVVV
uniref:Unannotated protein n=1 Tax=freshwater metagenome TaxID=449393 RepID=A0A6J7NQ18_9ZZZZ